MIKSQDKTVYPMETSKIISDGNILFDRDTRGKSWFFLYMYSPEEFLTADGEAFITSDGNQFYSK